MRRQIINSVYGTLKLEQLIGKGSYGQIYKASSTKIISGVSKFAVKVIISDSDPDSLPNIEKQIKILMSCHHQNIVKCYSVEIVDDAVWIVMQYCECGSLSDVMSSRKSIFSEQQIRKSIRGILRALEYLHSHKIMHRDIKAANVLLMSDGRVKVADFGVSTLISQTMMGKNTRTGSPFWMSPQLLSRSQYSYKTDIWSLGITAIQLAEGAPPYSHQHPYRAIFSIQSNPPQSLSHPQNWSQQFNTFIKQCLTINQNQRPSAQQLLKHKFLQSHKTPKIQQKYNSSLYNSEISQFQSKSQQQQHKAYHKQEDEDDNKYGTVIINDVLQENQEREITYSQLWTAEQISGYRNNCSKKMSNTVNNNLQHENYQNYCMEQSKLKNIGTFKINDNLDTFSLDPEILKAARKQFRTNSTQNKKQSQQQITDDEQIQKLYIQMQQQIIKIRMKYLKQIKQIQQNSLSTFEQSLRNQKNSGQSNNRESINSRFSKNKQNII